MVIVSAPHAHIHTHGNTYIHKTRAVAIGTLVIGLEMVLSTQEKSLDLLTAFELAFTTKRAEE